MHNIKFRKKSKKIQKIKKYHYGVISSPNRLEKAQREKIKIIVSFRSFPTRRVGENSKENSKKIQYIKRHRYGFISSQNRLEKAEKEKK